MAGKRVVIVGAGAVGGYIGAHMTKAGHDVTMVDPWPEHVETIRTRGLEISGMTPAEAFTQKMQAMHLTELQDLDQADSRSISRSSRSSPTTRSGRPT